MTDITLFKYRAVNKRLLQSIIDGTVFFALPSKLNDPFDCQVDINASLTRAIEESEGAPREYLVSLALLPNFAQKLHGGLAQVGICSFSMDMLNSLMWTHYADEHRGVCLMYRVAEEFFQDEQNEIIGLAPTEYGTNPLCDWFKNVVHTLGEPGGMKMGSELSKKLFSVKGGSWSHEKEVRAIRFRPGPLQFPEGSLRQICFGLRTSEDDIRLIRHIASNLGIVYCQVQRTDSDFGIGVVEI